jgi:DTW domain-containing protein YfiP
MHRSLCICSLLPRIETRTRVVLIVHQLEAVKPTNTRLVAARCLPSATVVYRGRAPEGVAPAGAHGEVGATPDWPAAVAAAAAGARPLVLYPHPSATPLEDWRGRTEAVALVVPDGTWAQATRIHARFAARAGDPPCVSLPASRTGKRLRMGRSPHQMATLEAVALALGILEGPAIRDALLHIYRVMADRTLWTNGRLPTEAVTGGIPTGVQSHDPLSLRRE